jgi:3-deoxy-manno-octulosonate cytidylyltransferase (CMP-KDO synthetase)
MFRVVIPARYASTRLPGKPLRLIAGRPMIEHVYERARASGAAEVIVATDDERIANACARFGADVALTDPGHASGTDRLAEVARLRRFAADDVVVNVQGDEPLLAPENVAEVAALLAAHPEAAIATLATPIEDLAEYLDANVVKVVRDAAGRALYFSRAPIPWQRDAAAARAEDASRYAGALRHIGLYAYRAGALRWLAALPPSPLESAERLEQLRALENGLAIAVGIAAVRPGPGVDTEADLARVAALIAAGTA